MLLSCGKACARVCVGKVACSGGRRKGGASDRVLKEVGEPREETLAWQ